jgi:hypothetical protein
VSAVSILDLPAPSAPPWQQTIPDDIELPALVEPAPHADDAYLPETRALLDAGREAIARWDAAVAAEHYVPDWARPMRGAS